MHLGWQMWFYASWKCYSLQQQLVSLMQLHVWLITGKAHEVWTCLWKKGKKYHYCLWRKGKKYHYCFCIWFVFIQSCSILSAYTEMGERIIQLVTESVRGSLFQKALACLKAFRADSVSRNNQVSAIILQNALIRCLKILMRFESSLMFIKLLLWFMIAIWKRFEIDDAQHAY